MPERCLAHQAGAMRSRARAGRGQAAYVREATDPAPRQSLPLGPLARRARGLSLVRAHAECARRVFPNARQSRRRILVNQTFRHLCAANILGGSKGVENPLGPGCHRDPGPSDAGRRRAEMVTPPLVACWAWAERGEKSSGWIEAPGPGRRERPLAIYSQIWGSASDMGVTPVWVLGQIVSGLPPLAARTGRANHGELTVGQGQRARPLPPWPGKLTASANSPLDFPRPVP